MFSIGEFSKRSGVSARMLRHYDEHGLLHPVYLGENGYRYYDEAQLPVIKQIETLKSYGFTLAAIRGLLVLSPDALAQCLHQRRLEAYHELQSLRQKIRQMEEDVIRMEGNAMASEKYHVIIMDLPQQHVFSIRKTINVSQTHELFAQLHQEMESRGIPRAGATQLLYHGREFSYENMDVEAQAVIPPEYEGTEIPAGSFAAVTHIGPYETIRYAYQALQEWMQIHPEYEICGPAIERYIKDESMAQSKEELETGVLFPVRKHAE